MTTQELMTADTATLSYQCACRTANILTDLNSAASFASVLLGTTNAKV
jgi:hypothetical protein